MAHEVIVQKEQPHKCELPVQGSLYAHRRDYVAYTTGTIIACSECGKYYYLYLWKSDVITEIFGDWKPIRWYHFGKKREIAGK